MKLANSPVEQQQASLVDSMGRTIEYVRLSVTDRCKLRPMLRDGISDEQLKSVLVESIRLKPAHHEFESNPEQINRCLSQTGG